MKKSENGTSPLLGGRIFWISFCAGIVAGAVTGLLYAPSEGADLMRKVADGAAAACSKASTAAENSVSLYGSTARTASFQINRLFKSVSAGFEEARRVREQLEAARGPEGKL